MIFDYLAMDSHGVHTTCPETSGEFHCYFCRW